MIGEKPTLNITDEPVEFENYTSRMKFKTAGKLPTILEESKVEYIPI
jgi:hypothetical protein